MSLTEAIDICDMLSIIKECKPYIKQVHDKAETKHDSYGEYYMDGVQYEIMQETEELLSKIELVISEIENPGD